MTIITTAVNALYTRECYREDLIMVEGRGRKVEITIAKMSVTIPELSQWERKALNTLKKKKKFLKTDSKRVEEIFSKLRKGIKCLLGKWRENSK